IDVRQRAQQHRIHHAENRGGRTDAERDRQNGGNRKCRLTTKAAEREKNVSNDRFHLMLPQIDRHVPCPSNEGLDGEKRPKVGARLGELLAGGVDDVRLRTASRILCGMKAFVLILVGVTAAGCATRAAEQAAPAKLTIENLNDIKHPSNPVW